MAMTTQEEGQPNSVESHSIIFLFHNQIQIQRVFSFFSNNKVGYQRDDK